MRTVPHRLRRLHGAHVMRIAEPRRTAFPSPPAGSCAYALETLLVARPPFTRSLSSSGLSTRSMVVARFFGPEGVLPTSATRRRTGTDRELVVPRSAPRGDFSSLTPLPSAAPSRGWHGLTSRAPRASEEAASADRADPSEGSRRLSAGEPLLEPDRTPLCRACACAEERNPSRIWRHTGRPAPRERATSHR